MTEWDQTVFERAVIRICSEASPGPDWASVAARIDYDIPWEFRYRYEVAASSRPEWFPPEQ